MKPADPNTKRPPSKDDDNDEDEGDDVDSNDRVLLDDEEEEDDRKPPAREVVVRPRTGNDSHEDDDDEHDDHEEEHHDEHEDEPHDMRIPLNTSREARTYCTDESVQSGMSSSMMTPIIRFPDTSHYPHHSSLGMTSPPVHKVAPPSASANNNNNQYGPLTMLNTQLLSSLTAQAQYNGSNHHVNHYNNSATLTQQEYEDHERDLRQRITRLVAAWLLSVTVFLYIILPYTAFCALVAATATSALTMQHVQRYAVSEFYHYARYRGFGELLPDRLVQLLTQESLHDFFMSTLHHSSESNSGSLHRYLVLYFLPGLTPDQRTAFIRRLPRRHRQVLERPGMGQFLGPQFMSLLLGRERYQQQQQLEQGGHHHNNARRLAQHPEETSSWIHSVQHHEEQEEEEEHHRRILDRALPSARLTAALHPHGGRRLDLDEESSAASDLGLDVGANDLTGGLSQEQAQSMARGLGLPPQSTSMAADHSAIVSAIEEEEEEIDDDDEEEDPLQALDDDDDDDEFDSLLSDEDATRIIVEAAIATMWAQFRRVTRPFTTSALNWMSRTTRQAASSAVGTSARWALTASSLGLASYWAVSNGLVGVIPGGMVQSMVSNLMARSSSLWLRLLGGGRSDGTVWPLWPTLVLGTGGVATLLYATTTRRTSPSHNPSRNPTRNSSSSSSSQQEQEQRRLLRRPDRKYDEPHPNRHTKRRQGRPPE